MDQKINQYKKDSKSSTFTRMLTGFLVAIFFLFCALFGAGAGIFLAVQDDLPSLAPLRDYNSAQWSLPTKVYSRDGELLAKFYEQRRQLISIENIPPELIQAVIAVEDSRFFRHNGVDFRGIFRAAVENITAGRIVEGGSTITQQLAKVLFLSSRQTFRRKIKEALLALKIERNYTKKQILERYFNKIYFGEGAYGVEAASQVYFGKSASELNIAESALLAALPKAPNYYSPISHPENARQRHHLVMNLLAKRGVLSQKAAEKKYRTFWSNYSKKLHELDKQKKKEIREAPYFVEHIRRKLLDKYGSDIVYQGGLTVKTTVDISYQKHLQNKLNNYLVELNKEQGNIPDTATKVPKNPRQEIIEGAVMLRNPNTGEILAMVGGHRWHLGNQLNRAVQSKRQPGSAFKPILYTAALDNGYTIASTLQDRPLIFQTNQGKWTPRNYSGEFHGRVTIRTALINSLNVATVDLFQKIGSRTVINYAEKLGINAKLRPHKSLALGGLRRGVSLKNILEVYGVFANEGVRTNSVAIREIRDREGNLLERNYPLKKAVISPQVAFLVTSLLKDVVDHGTGQVIGNYYDRPIAGKTGTTNEFRDAWFIGYTPSMTMGAWFGYDKSNRSMGEGMSGGVVAGTFWRDAAEAILKDKPIETFPVPNGIRYENIDPQTGYLATPQCPTTSREPFLTGTEPARRCPIHASRQVFK